MRRSLLPLLLALLPTAAVAQPHKELGRMWTFENVPLDWFKDAYGFEPDGNWLDKVRLSALRFGNGCSASFVSPHGLIMTNHHCARGDVAKASPAGEDWLQSGYFAKSQQDEVPLDGLKVRQLVSMKDVTAEVNAGLAELGEDEARKALAANISGVRNAADRADPDHEHQVVGLYQGGMYQLYSYKVYDDIRLVAIPQLDCQKFGGDPDNFTYPRYALDYSFVRAYEDGKPADTAAHYYKWRTAGPTEGETVFVIGNPGSTGRLKTVAQMEYLRDVELPAIVERLTTILERAHQRVTEMRDREQAVPPQLQSQILNFENSHKAYKGYLDGLRDDRVMEVKRKAEAAAREKIAADPELQKRFGGVWDELEQIQQQKRGGTGDSGDGSHLKQREEALEKRVGEAFFAIYGTAIAPDATFTLRISDGVVKGFPMNGTIAPWFTSLYGLYARHTEFGGVDPFDLPQIWLDKEEQLDLHTPFNLVCTADIIGGNSGSPLIDTDARVVGLIFDGNIQMLGNNYIFTDEIARSVAVHPSIIITSLRDVYDRAWIADELESGTLR